MESIRFVDLFCGIGGFRIAMDQACMEHGLVPACVFSSDIDPACQDSYAANFGHRPTGDITQVPEDAIPNHDLLLAGFPCQPFSIIGHMRGFQDIRGTLFFDIARILQHQRPKAFILENVKQLVGHAHGRTLKTILHVLENELGYHVWYAVLNALDYGLPQKRERVIMVGHRDPIGFSFPPRQPSYRPLSDLLEDHVAQKHYASPYIVERRKSRHTAVHHPSIWHENKSGNICSYPYSCALRAGASYNYLLVNGERRLTPREMFRLQGFPDSYTITANDGQARRQAGNAVPVHMVKAVLLELLPYVATSMKMAATLNAHRA